MPAGSFVWYELMSTDVAAAKTFYSKVVGWTSEDLPMPESTYTLLRVAQTQVGGMMPIPKDAAGMRPCWMGYVSVDDVDAGAVKVQRLGGEVHKAPTDIPNVGRFAVVTDPQGAAFYIFKSAQSGEPVASNDAGHIGWRELHSNDWPAAFKFYSEMFGWTKGDSVDMGPMGSYQLFKIGGEDKGAMFNSTAAQTARFWLFYFIAGDIDAAAKRVTDNGGKIVQGPTPVPGDRFVVQASDPQGAMFALLGTRQ